MSTQQSSRCTRPGHVPSIWMQRPAPKDLALRSPDLSSLFYTEHCHRRHEAGGGSWELGPRLAPSNPTVHQSLYIISLPRSRLSPILCFTAESSQCKYQKARWSPVGCQLVRVGPLLPAVKTLGSLPTPSPTEGGVFFVQICLLAMPTQRRSNNSCISPYWLEIQSLLLAVCRVWGGENRQVPQRTHTYTSSPSPSSQAPPTHGCDEASVGMN